jgi:hypothetical protein
MKNLRYFIALLAAVPVAILIGKGVSTIDASGYVMKSKKASPSGRYTIYEIESVSQEGPAPHGQHLVLSDKVLVMKPDDGEVIFAGYCSPPPTYIWKGEHQISIQCKATEKEAANAQDRIKTVRGIQVKIQYLR